MPNLHELKKDTLKRYIDKAHSSSRTAWVDRIRKQGKERIAAEKKYERRGKGLDRAMSKVYSEEALQELKKTTIKSYISKAKQDKYYSDKRLDSLEYGVTPNGQEIADTQMKRMAKRDKGIATAQSKLKEETMELTESQRTLLESYQDSIVPMLVEAVSVLELDEELAESIIDEASSLIEDALFATVAETEDAMTGDELKDMVAEALTIIVEESTEEEQEVDVSVPALLAMIELGEKETANAIFNEILADRISGMLSDVKAELATSLFAPALETQEEIGEETEQLDELSTKTLTNYTKRAAENMSGSKFFAGKYSDKDAKKSERHFVRGDKRMRGIVTAAKKLASKAKD